MFKRFVYYCIIRTHFADIVNDVPTVRGTADWSCVSGSHDGFFGNRLE